MGYRVVYGSKKACGDSSGIRIGRTAVMTVVSGVLFLYAVTGFWPAGEQVLEKLISYHGFREIHGYLDTLVMELQCGTSLGQAVTAFCRDVVQMGLSYAS